MIQVHIDVQKCNLGWGDVPCKMDEVTAIVAFKEMGRELGQRTKKEDVIDKPEVRLIEFEMKEVMLKNAHEQVNVGWGHAGAIVVPLTWRYCRS